MSTYMKMMQKRAAEEKAAEELKQSERLDTEASVAVPGPSGEVNPAQSVAVREKPLSRPQPFTPDLIPEPKEVEAEGDLTTQEAGDLANCEAAFVYADQAEWMRGKAAHAVRSRRLYRGGGRLWPEYCEEVLGGSESEVNRMIQQWQLACAISQLWTRPTPSSHIQALLPAVGPYGEEQIASGYVELRAWAAESGMRITAADLTAWVKKVRTAVQQKAAPPSLTGQSLAQVREERGRVATRKPLPEPRGQAAADPGSEPKADSSMLNHPNLGDSTLNYWAAPAATLDEAGEERAIRAWSVLEGITEGLVGAGVLRGASTPTLKEFERTARRLADAAAEILKER